MTVKNKKARLKEKLERAIKVTVPYYTVVLLQYLSSLIFLEHGQMI